MLISSTPDKNLLADTGEESSAASWFLFSSPPNIGELMDLLAVGEDSGSDLIERFFVIKLIFFPPSACLLKPKALIYLCPEFARSKASLCGSGLFAGANGEWDDDGEKGGCAIPE